MPMRGALANPGEGVVGRVRRLRGSYGAPGREGDQVASPSSGYGCPAVEAGEAMPRGACIFFHSAAATA